MQLLPEQIVIGIGGQYWVDTVSQKTDVKVRVPLLPIARKILEQYGVNLRAQAHDNVFPHISNQKYKEYG
ncbi:MAG: site-specific integrase [Daejeonella sp.]